MKLIIFVCVIMFTVGCGSDGGSEKATNDRAPEILSVSLEGGGIVEQSISLSPVTGNYQFVDKPGDVKGYYIYKIIGSNRFSEGDMILRLSSALEPTGQGSIMIPVDRSALGNYKYAIQLVDEEGNLSNLWELKISVCDSKGSNGMSTDQSDTTCRAGVL